MDVQQLLAVIGEPTRFRIIVLLAAGPRTVGELAVELGTLQPQTTKHVQALEAAGVVRVQRLGRRRLARLDRDTLRRLGAWFDGLATETEDDAVLRDYAASVADAEARTAGGDPLAAQIELDRRIPAPPDAVWRAWTDSQLAAQWWAPRHFDVVRCSIDPNPAGHVELVIREGDGTEYVSAGSVSAVDPGRRLSFELSPLDHQGRTAVRVELDARIEGEADSFVRLTIRASGGVAGAAPMIAGLRAGWSQQLDKLEELMSGNRG